MFKIKTGKILSNDVAQTIDVILAWLIAEDDGAKKKVIALLADRDEDLSLIRGTLQGKSSNILGVSDTNPCRTTGWSFRR